MRIFLTRHGEMETYDNGKPLQSHGISTVGEVQSILFGEHLAAYDKPTIVCGPSARHVETADCVSNVLAPMNGNDIEITVIEGFDDARWGKAALQSAGERELTQQEWAEALVTDDLPVEEPFPEVRERILASWEQLLNTKSGTVVVVTSFIVVAVILAELLSLSLDPPRFYVHNTGLSEILLKEDTQVVVQMNSTGHLSTGLLTTSWDDY